MATSELVAVAAALGRLAWPPFCGTCWL